jgi:methylmalonyl-CoA mutase
MELGYQRGLIQEESLLYETRKHDGSLPIVGVNTFVNPNPPPQKTTLTLIRGTEEEKQGQIRRLREFQAKNAAEAPKWLARLQDAARKNENVFAVLMDAARYCSLGQITNALFEVGGQYRRSM